MKLVILAIYDRQLDAFMTPFFAQSVNAGIRSFGDLINSNPQEMEAARHPDDYDLYHLGEFDSDKGTLTMVDKLEPQQVAVGKNLVKVTPN